jgi:Rrf2 family protein
MTLLTRKVDYALLLLSYLHQRPEGGSAREIAAHFDGLSRAFVANILKDLCQKGFVASHRGVKGGYVLQRPADEINLAELMEALDDAFHLAECTRESGAPGHDPCSFLHTCQIKGAVASVHDRIREVLRGVTLAELFRPAVAAHEGLFGLELLTLEKQLASP